MSGESMTAADGILMNLVVREPGEEPLACPWDLLVDGREPCDGHTCALCRSAAARRARQEERA